MNINHDLDVLKKYTNTFEEGLYYDAIKSLENDLDPEDLDQINKTDNLKTKIQTLLDIITKDTGPKEKKLIKKFKEFLRDNYSWLYDYFRQNYDKNSSNNTLNIGGVPVLPERNVTRKEALKKVRDGFESLSNSDVRFLVLYGPIGCGKSSLATQALHDQEILHYFKDGVFWVMVGSDGKSKIRILQEDLNVRLQDRDQNLSPNTDVALIQLRQKYVETKKNCLIILDDVHSEDVVKYLDVGVKFCITTRDQNVIKDNKSISVFVEVPDHFKHDESLELISLSLNMDVQYLPKSRINNILKFCKGHPISVAIISAELADHKEDLKEGKSERWNHYIKTLKHNKKNLNEYSDKYMKSAINLAIESLSPRLKSCFECFAVFPEDVNLRPEVLATVWGKEKTEAENIMADLGKKSLVVRYWNESLSTYVYGVHDVFLDYLKSSHVTSLDKIKAMHKNLLDKYLNPYSWDASKLPKNDNYIFYYLGYHLLKAGLENLFPKIYTNLEFLEAKLRAVEPFDLVLDLKRYHGLISNKQNEQNVAALKEFVEWYGPFIHKGLDIAQLALQEPHSSFIYNKGKELAQKRMNMNKNIGYIYFPLKHVERREWLPRTINMRDKQVTALCFDPASNIVIATKGGSLELWNTKCIRLKIFTGHKDDITHLTTSLTKLFSCSNDKTIREWKLENDNNSEDKYDLSPERTQDSYHDFWLPAKRGIEACQVLELPGPILWIAVDKFNIAAIFMNSKMSTELIIFKNYNRIKQIVLPKLKICEYTKDGLYIIAGGLEGVHIINTENFATRIPITSPTIGLSTLQNGELGGLVTISKDRVDFWGDQTVKVVDGHHFTKPIEEKGAKYSLFYVGYHIALVTEKNDILILDSDTGRTLQFISGEYTEKLIAIAIKQGMILAAYSNNKIEIKPIDIVDVPISKIFWPMSQNLPVVARVEKSTDLRVIKGNETIQLFASKAPVNNLSMIYSDKCEIVYSTNWGNVFLVDVKSKRQVELDSFNFTCPTTVLETFEFETNTYIAASTSIDDLKILDIKNRNMIDFKNTQGVNFCSLTKTGQLILSTLDSVQVWDFSTKEKLYSIDFMKILTINELKSLIVMTNNKECSILNVKTRKTIWKKSEENMRFVSLSPDGRKLSYISKKKIYVNDIINGALNVYNIPDFTSCHSYNSMAVTNQGVVCVSTNQPCVFVASPVHGVISAAVQVSSLISSSDSFAAIDKLGLLHILKPIDFNLNLDNLTI